MSRYAAYIDESGNHDLQTEKEGASRYFLVLAIVVEAHQVAWLTAQVEAIRARFFGAGEMKSSRVKDERRVEILDALGPLPLRFYAVAVDKSRVDKDSGLAYKTSFIKFANGRLYGALFQHLQELTIYADGHGGESFIESFRAYLQTNHVPDLFTRPQVEIVDSRDSVLVQLADFLVGTAAKLYEGKAHGEFRKVFLEFLRAKRIRIDEWPPRYEVPSAGGSGSHELDAHVARISLTAAARFLAHYEDSGDPELQAQHALLSYLLFHASYSTEERFIPTAELVEHLHTAGFRELEKHGVRTNLVARLRDRDVIIASSSRGYKIPTTYADMLAFADLVEGMALPLMHRLKRANDAIALGSAGKADVLSEEKFRRLRKILDADLAG
jgi:Protein of unknown function (DUF3800)